MFWGDFGLLRFWVFAYFVVSGFVVGFGLWGGVVLVWVFGFLLWFGFEWFWLYLTDAVEFGVCVVDLIILF